MEGKRSRLKRKPKVSPVPVLPKESQDVQEAKQPSGKLNDQAIVAIDNESPVGKLTEPSPSKVLTASEDHNIKNGGLNQVGSTALCPLTQVLLFISQSRRRLPLDSLPDLPSYQPPVAYKGDNQPAAHDTLEGLPPLPKICPCKLKRRKRDNSPLALSPERTHSTHNKTKSQPRNPQLQGRDEENAKVNFHKEDSEKMTIVHTRETHNVNQSNKVLSTSQMPDLPAVPSSASVSVREKSNLRPSSPSLDETAASSSTASVTKPSSFVKSSQSKESAPTLRLFSGFKEKSPSACLFSKFSSVPSPCDDRHEFEDTNVLCVTNLASSSIGARQKRPASSTSSQASTSKRTKTGAGSSKPVTKTLDSTKTKSIFSSVKKPPSKKSQPSISSFSVKSSHEDSREGRQLMSQQPRGGSTGRPESSVANASEHRIDSGNNGKNSDLASSKVADERVKSCPLCQTSFSTALSQVEIDGHIAACLSANDDDIVW